MPRSTGSRDIAPRVVLVRLSALGDVVHTWPLAEALRTCKPSIHLTWVVEEALRDLVEGHPAVDQVITVSTTRWRRSPFSARTRSEITQLRDRFGEDSPDFCLDSQGVIKSAILTKLINAKKRIGLARPWRRELIAGFAYTDTVPGGPRSSHVVSTNLQFLRPFGASPPSTPPVPSGDWLRAKWQDPQADPAEEKPYAVLLPAAGRPGKILNVATLATAAASISRATFPVIVAWGPGERERAEAIVQQCDSNVRLAPSTNLVQLAQLLDNADLVIGADTGPVHLAASLSTPTLAVFLDTSTERNGPLGAKTRVISGAAEEPTTLSGSAHAIRKREISADEISASAINLLRESKDTDSPI
ncbi:MAG: lipopolysaccharide heptosyltransferase I [bacterium]|nr:lipopolysaccharide heptosyltransferase I [bacterium]